ncbi:MAG TPA: heavy metal translocating P-type ATPase metal-binding domain-containing protein [Puia sp.]|uniref:heavy metal translocating P-type ATPase n=1 Tax=Puia sp. TaxID=2045100 RepID=UPI002C57E356|nr:heavy metal translocating P-type ATPase metal-binding domain-containing protein [Puia sp.]HVU94142.1 heavy metal translocating P-type ATPase metal-binding domain-containing protein [Puia sp.]
MSTATDKPKTALRCTHCGDPCPTNTITLEDKPFCCEGCRMVWQLLDHNGLCQYYDLNAHPGQSLRHPVRKDKFAFLDDEKIAAGLIRFQSENETHVGFYLPAIHCSSCLYLLENLRRLDPAIQSSRIDFGAKEIAIVFDPKRISLRQVAELLTSLGYEPYISLHDLGNPGPGVDRRLIYRLGVAGFCFGNIMLLCFPEYLGLNAADATLQQAFRYLSLLLSLPVFFYCAQPFYSSAWKGLSNKYLNIDAPIVLAILVTFARSAWDVLSGSGSGYFDSMSGIVFFMLAGRVLQDRTYRQLSFDRDYTSYFPVAVTVLQSQSEPVIRSLPDIRCGDTLRIHNGELIPADGILTRGRAFIDYSFVTGESIPVTRSVGELVYAGGRQTGGAIELLVVKEVAQSYLTQLWNRQSTPEAPAPSFVNALSRNFTLIVFLIAAAAATYWQIHNPANTWKAVTAVLIVACPCALLLSSTFTNGNLLRILGRNGLYLRNAGVLEDIARATHIVFDKTGTLTDTNTPVLAYSGAPLTNRQEQAIALLTAQSAHPLSKALAGKFCPPTASLTLHDFWEYPGKGIEGYVDGNHYTIGSAAFVEAQTAEHDLPGSRVFVACNHKVLGSFTISSHYREGLRTMLSRLDPRLHLSVLSGDSAREADRLRNLLGIDIPMLFTQSPLDKCRYISCLQKQGGNIMMIGDGLNDAGALKQSDTGIAVSADSNNFTPASDAILKAESLQKLPAFIRLCRAGRRIIVASFALSIIYNAVGLWFAVHAALSPLLAAILMPASTLSILLITYGSSNFLAKRAMRMPVEQDQPAD